MYLYFPQWQGARSGQAMLEGAVNLRKYFSGLDFNDIALSLMPSSTPITDSGKLLAKGLSPEKINNYDVILEQFNRCRLLLSEHDPESIWTIGGDCGLELGPVSFLNAKYNGNLAVIWFDAHGDINTPDDSPSMNFHGMPLRTLLGEGNEELVRLLPRKLISEQLVYCGIRDLDDTEKKFIERKNISVHTSALITDVLDTLKSKGLENLYIHFDFDVLDPHVFPDSYYKVQNGWTVDDCTQMLTALGSSFNIVGFSLLESTAKDFQSLLPISPILDLWKSSYNS